MKIIFTILLGMIFSVSLLAQPSTITYQGKLLDNNGIPVNQNSVAMTFAIYNAASAGTKVWPSSGTVSKSVNVVSGLYSVTLGTGSGNDDAFNSTNLSGAALYLEVTVAGNPLPRTLLTAVPYAILANPNWASPGTIGSTTPNTGNFTRVTTTNTGTSTDAISATISNASSVQSVVTATHSGIGSGIQVQLTNGSNGGRGVDVAQSGVGPGVFATSAGGNAVWGITSSISAAGVIGDNTFGEAVVGRNRGGNGVGAVVGRNDSSGYGVRGFNTKNGYGVLGQAGISGGTGTAGRFENVNAANTSDALQVTTNSSGNAARFTGNVVVNGNLTVSGTVAKGGGSFMIDHPLDPENKLLYHSFVESPDMKNIYDGVVILDKNGEAWVQLPEWFEAVNQDFRYLLTAIGAPAPNLYIATEVKNNKFQIAGGVAGKKVSWQVTGIRHDPFSQKHRIQVEVDKKPEDKGTYIHPDVYNQEIKTEQRLNNPNNMNNSPSSRDLNEDIKNEAIKIEEKK